MYDFVSTQLAGDSIETRHDDASAEELSASISA